MPRPSLHNIQPDQLLAAIVGQYRRELFRIAQERAVAQSVFDKTHPDWERLWASGGSTALRALESEEHELTEGHGLLYDLPGWLGYMPTASQRIIAQRAVRELESKGLLIVLGAHARYVRPTPEGLAAVPALEARQ